MGSQPSSSHLVILAKTPLARLGLAEFIQDLRLVDSSILSLSSLSALQEKLQKITVTVLVVEFNGTPGELAYMGKWLLILQEQYPQLRIVLYTASRDMTILTPLHRQKQFSLIAQQEPLEQLRRDMALALVGRKVCSPGIDRCLGQFGAPKSLGLCMLTAAESRVMTHLLAGLSLTEIAALCHRSIKTISAHKCNGMRKLGVRNDAELFQLPLGDIVQVAISA